MSRTPIQEATAIVAKLIRQREPDFWHGQRDLIGHKINVHYNDGDYAATLNYETRAWCDYDFLDRIDEALGRADLPFAVEYLSEYEVCFTQL